MGARRIVTGAFALFFAIGLLLIGVGVKVTRDARASEGWPRAQGEVVHTAVETRTETRSHRSTRGLRHSRRVTLHRPDVRYRYSVDGMGYLGTRVSFYDVSTDDAGRAQTVVARYPIGTPVGVFYDPADPGRSVLEPGVKETVQIPMWIGLGFVAISGAAIAGIPYLSRQGQLRLTIGS